MHDLNPESPKQIRLKLYRLSLRLHDMRVNAFKINGDLWFALTYYSCIVVVSFDVTSYMGQ